MADGSSCPSCGAQISERSVFCPSCGARQAAFAGDDRLPRTFWNSVKICFNKYASFEGRAPRAEYWYWTLFTLLVWLVVRLVAEAIDAANGTVVGRLVSEVLLFLVLFVPGVAVAVRRLHDRDKSGWWYLLIFIPVVGAIILLVWFCIRGMRGRNRFGPDPLAEGV